MEEQDNKSVNNLDVKREILRDRKKKEFYS